MIANYVIFDATMKKHQFPVTEKDLRGNIKQTTYTVDGILNKIQHNMIKRKAEKAKQQQNALLKLQRVFNKKRVR